MVLLFASYQCWEDKTADQGYNAMLDMNVNVE